MTNKQTDRLTNKVTSSLLELLVAAKNVSTDQSWMQLRCNWMQFDAIVSQPYTYLIKSKLDQNIFHKPDKNGPTD